MKPLKPATRFQLILCGIDFSRQSAAALRHAAALARARGARLVAAYVMDPLLPAAAAAAYDRRGLTATALPELQRFVRTTLGRSQADAIRCTVVLGKPAR